MSAAAFGLSARTCRNAECWDGTEFDDGTVFCRACSKPVYAVAIDDHDPPEFVAEDHDGVYARTRVDGDSEFVSGCRCRTCGSNSFQILAKMHHDRPPDWPYVECVDCGDQFRIQSYESREVVF